MKMIFFNCSVKNHENQQMYQSTKAVQIHLRNIDAYLFINTLKGIEYSLPLQKLMKYFHPLKFTCKLVNAINGNKPIC